MIKKFLALIFIVLFAVNLGKQVIGSGATATAGTNQITLNAKQSAEVTNCQLMGGADSKTTAEDVKRRTTYQAISTHLALLSNEALSKLLAPSKALRQEAFEKQEEGPTPILDINGTKVFYKEIPLTDLELKPENIMSTKNIFHLPNNYYYGVGSTGFGAWRELFANILATNWVLTGECENFSLMYHWRILPKKVTWPTSWVESMSEKWGGLPAIRPRLEAKRNATHELILFLEYIPKTLYEWLPSKLAQENTASTAVSMIERDLKKVISFMQSKGLLHFDVGPFNILTDGNQLYFADFGQAISKQFELSKEEIEFFNNHHNYDLYESVFTCLAMPIIDHIYKKNNWIANRDILQEFIDGKRELKTLPSWAASIIVRYGPIVVIMINFFDKFYSSPNKAQFFSKPIIFPSEALAKAYQEGNAKADSLKKN